MERKTRTNSIIEAHIEKDSYTELTGKTSTKFDRRFAKQSYVEWYFWEHVQRWYAILWCQTSSAKMDDGVSMNMFRGNKIDTATTKLWKN